MEVPCLGKNVTAGRNALATSSMALAGFKSVIPLDQVINTVKIVGRSMSSTLCCTGKGGLAVTPKSRELKEMLKNLGEKNQKYPTPEYQALFRSVFIYSLGVNPVIRLKWR